MHSPVRCVLEGKHGFMSKGYRLALCLQKVSDGMRRNLGAGVFDDAAALGTRWAADAAERTEDTGPRLLYAPRRIYLGDRPGEPGP